MNNRDKVLARGRRWRANNLERALAKEREKYARNKIRANAAGKRWRDEHPEKVLALARKRDLALINRIPPWADLDAIEAMYVERARISDETGIRHDVDHVIPLQGKLVSGLHVHTNLHVITTLANRRKRNRFNQGDHDVTRSRNTSL